MGRCKVYTRHFSLILPCLTNIKPTRKYLCVRKYLWVNRLQFAFEISVQIELYLCKFDIHGSVHRSMTQLKYQQDAACNRIYYSKVY